MKVKFLKDYRFIENYPGDDFDKTVHTGDVIDLEHTESAKWLIDNGFAEEVKESSWEKPTRGDNYYFINGAGVITSTVWMENSQDRIRYLMGNCFRTTEAAERYRDYLGAVATVSHDDGFMRKNGGGFGWPVIEYTTNNPGVDDIAGRQHAGEFYFDTREHALSSAMNHTREWQTILNYDWSRE